MEMVKHVRTSVDLITTEVETSKLHSDFLNTTKVSTGHDDRLIGFELVPVGGRCGSCVSGRRRRLDRRWSLYCILLYTRGL